MYCIHVTKMTRVPVFCGHTAPCPRQLRDVSILTSLHEAHDRSYGKGRTMSYTYVTGGASSGKSRFALEHFIDRPDVTFIATGVETDEEMTRRIELHRASRPSEWKTVEEPFDLIRAVLNSKTAAIIVDCLSFWVSNLMYSKKLDYDGIVSQATAVAAFLEKADGEIVVVTNELGMGLIPEREESRAYRKTAGEVNQIFAEHAKDAYFVVSGINLKIK